MSLRDEFVSIRDSETVRIGSLTVDDLEGILREYFGATEVELDVHDDFNGFNVTVRERYAPEA